MSSVFTPEIWNSGIGAFFLFNVTIRRDVIQTPQLLDGQLILSKDCIRQSVVDIPSWEQCFNLFFKPFAVFLSTLQHFIIHLAFSFREMKPCLEYCLNSEFWYFSREWSQSDLARRLELSREHIILLLFCKKSNSLLIFSRWLCEISIMTRYFWCILALCFVVCSSQMTRLMTNQAFCDPAKWCGKVIPEIPIRSLELWSTNYNPLHALALPAEIGFPRWSNFYSWFFGSLANNF